VSAQDHPTFWREDRAHLRVVETRDERDVSMTGCAQVAAGWVLLALFSLGCWIAVGWGIASWL
jgi:hypothetical protein